MWKIIYPLRYFRISNREKIRLDVVPTAIISIIIIAPFCIFQEASFFGVNGFLDNLITLTAALTGFYVAALVAAATFNHPDLDKTIRAGPVALVTKDSDGKTIQDFLTRREFACTVFGYLAYSALFFSISGALALSLRELSPLGDYHFYIRLVAISIFSIWISHIAVATALGIYYLMDRLYRRDRQITTKKPNSDRAA